MTRDHDLRSKCSNDNPPAFDREMMVRCPQRVECSAKIAMSVLFDTSTAMDLLRDYDLPRRIFLGANSSITTYAAELAAWTANNQNRFMTNWGSISPGP
jgi:hypothetical protein